MFLALRGTPLDACRWWTLVDGRKKFRGCAELHRRFWWPKKI